MKTDEKPLVKKKNKKKNTSEKTLTETKSNIKNLDERTVAEMKISTAAYMISILIGIIIACFASMLCSFIDDLNEYLTYHNSPEDFGQKLHYVNLREMYVCGVLSVTFLILLVSAFKSWIKKIKSLKKKSKAIRISILTIIASIIFEGGPAIILLEVIIKLII